MQVLRSIVLYVHLVGFALLLGGAIAQYAGGRLRVNAAMLWGAVIQVLTGVVLAVPFGLGTRSTFPVPALAVKLVLALAILAMVYFPRRRDAVNRGHFLAIVGLVLVEAGVGVFWLH